MENKKEEAQERSITNLCNFFNQQMEPKNF